jgi:dolichol-phosphate mannosyltransferase
MPTLVAHALDGRLPPLAAPDTARDFVFVDDACDAFVRATAAAPGSVYNVASGRQTTLAQLVALVREQFGVTAAPRWNSMASRSWDTSTWVGDPARIERELGWRATTSVGEGLQATARWLQCEAGERERHL